MQNLTSTKTSAAVKLAVALVLVGGIAAATGIVMGLLRLRQSPGSDSVTRTNAGQQTAGATPFTPFLITNVQNNTPPTAREEVLELTFRRSDIILGALPFSSGVFVSSGPGDFPPGDQNPLAIVFANNYPVYLPGFDVQFRTLTIDDSIVCLPAWHTPDGNFSITYYVSADGTTYFDSALTQSALPRSCPQLRPRSTNNQVDAP